MSDQLSASDDTKVAIPIRNLISILGAVAVSTWAYSGVIERLNKIETGLEIKKEHIDLNTEFRIGWPRGTMGSLPADSRQDMTIDAIQREMENMWEEIEENDNWIDEFEPPKEVLDAVKRVREIEMEMHILRTELNQLLDK